jgi:tRNA (guanine37-N1)-methyltransferase
MGISHGIRVAPRDAEKVKKLLREHNSLDSKKVRHDHGVVFPVKDLDFDLKGIPFEAVSMEFEDLKHNDEFETLIKKIGLPLSSYDVIGSIAVLEIPKFHEIYQRKLAETLMKSKGHIKGVFKKSSAVMGDERVRSFDWLAGEKRTETVHREHNCQFKLDIRRVFFSPRLSYERLRIKDQVKSGERVVDMFAGVGPYSIVIAKQKDVKVWGYDINRDAIQHFKENIRINKVGDRVEAFHGDCAKLAPLGKADRVIMNLPKKGKQFIKNAIDLLKPGGGIIHYYGVSSPSNPFAEESSFVNEKVKEQGKSAKTLGMRIVRSYSPREVHIAIDVEVKP